MTKIIITPDDFHKFVGSPSLNLMNCSNLPKKLVVPDIFLREYYKSIEYDNKTEKLIHEYEYSRDKFIVTSDYIHHESGKAEIHAYEYELYNHFLHKDAVFVETTITTELKPENNEKEKTTKEKAEILLKSCSDLGIMAVCKPNKKELSVVWKPTKNDKEPITIEQIYKKNEKIREVACGIDLKGIVNVESYCDCEDIKIRNTDILEFLRQCDGLNIRIKVELIDKEVVVGQDKEGRSYLVEKQTKQK